MPILSRSPVTATGSGRWAHKSSTRRFKRPMSLSRSRPRFQLMKPMTRLSLKSAKPGIGAGLKCGSVICAMTKLIPGRPSWRSAKARRPRAIDRVEIRLLERKDNPGWGREYPQYGRVDWRKAEAPRGALGRPRHADT